MNDVFICATLVFLTLFCASSFAIVFLRFKDMKKIFNLLNENYKAGNRHWMAVYETLKPEKEIHNIHKDELKIIELSSSMSVTMDMEEFATEGEIADELCRDISKQLRPYIEVAIDKDIRRCTTNYYARLRVASKAERKEI